MKDKNVAALLALLFGGLGIHRFYLGQKGLGIAYLLFWWLFFIPFLLGFIDAVILFTMSQEDFDYKYNRRFLRQQQGYQNPTMQSPYQPPYNQKSNPAQPKTQAAAPPPSNNANILKQNGITKFKDYDYNGAIDDFEAALKYNTRDVAIWFNLACAYSLTEQTEKGFTALSNAVTLGFNDTAKIKTHDALAFLRVQPEWDAFAESGFKNIPAPKDANQPDHSNLLEQLKKLAEMREKGQLSEAEFATQSKKLFS